MTTPAGGVPGLTGRDDLGIGLCRDRGGARVPRRRARMPVPAPACSLDDDGEWMHEHLNVHPRAVMQVALLQLRRSRAIFEVFQYSSPDQNPSEPRNSDIGGHHVALYVEDLDDDRLPSAACAARLRGADHQQGSQPRPALGVLPGSGGDAVRAGQLPEWQGVLQAGLRRHSRRTVGGAGARTCGSPPFPTGQ